MKKWVAFCLRIETACYLLMVLCVLPLYYTRGYERIGNDKAELFQMICNVSFAAVLPVFVCYIWLYRKSVILTVLDIWVLLYGASVVLSYLCSEYKLSVAWGYDAWGLGMYPQLMMVFSYFLVSGFWRKKEQKYILFLGLAVLCAESLLCIANRFMIDPLGMQKALYASDIPYWEKGNFLSTIGNINWISGYLCVTLFVAVGLYWQGYFQKKWERRILRAVCFAGLLALVLQGSNTGHGVLAVMGLAGLWLSVKDASRMKRWWELCVMLFGGMSLTWILIHAGGRFNYRDSVLRLLVNSPLPFCGLFVSVVLYMWIGRRIRTNRYPQEEIRMGVKFFLCLCGGSLAVLAGLCLVKTLSSESLPMLPEEWFVLNARWGVERGANIRAGFACFDGQTLLHKLFGVGPDGMVQAIYSAADTSVRDSLYLVQGEKLLTNAHCEWLTMLVNGGFAGAIAFAGMSLCAMRKFLEENDGMTKACGLGILAYTLHNALSFGTVLSMPVFFLLLGVGNARPALWNPSSENGEGKKGNKKTRTEAFGSKQSA